MSQVNVIRAWKNEEYRNSLSEAERAALPENPAEFLEQTEAELEKTTGGMLVPNTVLCYYASNPLYSIGGCQSAACWTTQTVTVQTINQSIQYGAGV
jgi:mersacidin/lichenicidin family type 2 lantibiotic